MAGCTRARAGTASPFGKTAMWWRTTASIKQLPNNQHTANKQFRRNTLLLHNAKQGQRSLLWHKLLLQS